MAAAPARLMFRQIPWKHLDWDESAAYHDYNLFHSKAWIEFLAEVQRAEPIAAILTDGTNEYGRFVGLVVRRMGMKFLGCPLPGWTTPYMGMNVKPDISRGDAANALANFAFGGLGCVHFELRDRWLQESEVAGLGFGLREDVGYDDRTFELDLTQSEDSLFNGMDSACRRCIRQGEKRGVTVEEATDDEFADEFYAQITDVFVRQGLVPTYSADRVKALIRHLQPAGQLLLLRARNAAGVCIATGIFPAAGDVVLFWGGASLKEHQNLRPNETLHWYAMRYWKARGIARYDMGGYMEYKRKYGGAEVAIPGFRKSRSQVISAARSLAPRGMRAKQLVLGRVYRGRIPHSDGPAQMPITD